MAQGEARKNLCGAGDLDILFRPGGAETAGSFGRPIEDVNVHAAPSHFGVPGMVNDKVGFGVRTGDDGVVARSDDIAGDGAENAGTGFISRIGVWTKWVAGRAVIDTVALALVTAAAVEAIVDSVAFSDAWSFESVPVVSLSVHGTVRLESLPVATGAEDGFVLAGEAGHIDEAISDEGCSGAHIAGKIEEIAGIKEIPLTVIIAKRVSVDREGTFITLGEERPGIFVRAGGLVADGDAQRMFQTFGGERIVQIKSTIIVCDLGGPEDGAFCMG